MIAPRVQPARGAVLLEVIVALAIFVGAGALILGSLSRATQGLAHTRDLEQAADLARSTMARVESGIARPETLIGQVQEDANERGSFSGAATFSPWWIEIETQPAAFEGLTHVTVRAVKKSADDREIASYTLHQLVRLFGEQAEGAGEEDPLAERVRRPDSQRPGERAPPSSAPGASPREPRSAPRSPGSAPRERAPRGGGGR